MRRYARKGGDSEAETRVVAIQFDNPARVGFAQRRTTAQIAQRADLAQDCERLAYADPVRVDVSPIRRCESWAKCAGAGKNPYASEADFILKHAD